MRLRPTENGLVMRYMSREVLCTDRVCVVFPGNDEYPTAFSIFGLVVPKYRMQIIDGGEREVNDPETHIVGEESGRFGEEYLIKLKDWIRRHRTEKALILSDDNDIRIRVRRELGIRCIFLEDRPIRHSSVVISDWLNRTMRTGEPALKIWMVCQECKKANYPPARWAITRLLEYYDQRARVKRTPFKPKSHRPGYG